MSLVKTDPANGCPAETRVALEIAAFRARAHTDLTGMPFMRAAQELRADVGPRWQGNGVCG